MEEPREEEQIENEDNTTMQGLARGIARMLEESDEIEEVVSEKTLEDVQADLLAKENIIEEEADSVEQLTEENTDKVSDSPESSGEESTEDSSEDKTEEAGEETAESETEGEKLDLQPIVESILFVNEKPISASEIAKPLELDRAEVESTLKRLMEIYDGRAGGLRIFKVSGGYQMRTSAESVDWVKKLYRNKFKRRLSNSALEVLSIVAYKQPITKMELEAIRGVDCDGVVRSLSNMGLVKIKGRKDVIGRPFLYGTSDSFLEHFGLNSLRDMPKIDFEEEAVALSKLEQKDDGKINLEQLKEAIEENTDRDAIDVEAVAVKSVESEAVVTEAQEEQKDGS